MQLLTELRRRLIYDATKGELRRRPGFTGVTSGAMFGSLSSGGKLQATFMGKRYQVDALVWLWETGALPNGPIAHKNLNNGDNRFANLAIGRRGSPASHTQTLRDRFISKSRAKFGDAHDYTAVDYVNMQTSVTIKCAVHGQFRRKPERYLHSEMGCPTCCSERAYALLRKPAADKIETARSYRMRNRKLYNDAARKWYLANRHHPETKAARACRNALNRVLAVTKSSKTAATDSIHGFSMLEFKTHIENQFSPWMTWANHGQWHVDHIVPVTWFVRRGVTDPAVINALDNLRPLPAVENLRKKDKLLPSLTPAIPLVVARNGTGPPARLPTTRCFERVPHAPETLQPPTQSEPKTELKPN